MGYFDNMLGGREGRFADASDINRAGFYRKGGIYLGKGRLTGRRLHYNGEGASIIIGKPEVGKTTKLVIPTLLTYQAGSVVVTDPKGTLTPQTDERRKALGNRVVYLNPWREELREAVGVDYQDTGFNPLSLLDPAKGVGSVKDNAALIARILCPSPSGNRDNFWNDGAARILSDVMVFLAFSPAHDCTLTALFRLTHGVREDWENLCRDMVALPSVDLTAAAKNILNNLSAPKQWAGLDGVLKDAVKIYDPDKPLGKHVEKNGFNPDDLKREKMTVYLVCPSGRRADNAKWFSLVMSLCAEAIARGAYTHPIMLMIEEMGNLGYFPMTRFLAELREAGLRAVLTLQSIRQLNIIYGQEEARLIVDLCAVRQFLQPDDLETARLVSDTLGDYEHLEADERGKIVVRERRPIMRPHEVMRLGLNEQIIMPSGRCPPIMAGLKPYFAVPEWERLTGANPLRKESVSERLKKHVRSAFAVLARAALWLVAVGALVASLLAWGAGGVLGLLVAAVVLWLVLWRYPLPSRFWAALGGGNPALAVNGQPSALSKLMTFTITALFIIIVLEVAGGANFGVTPRLMMALCILPNDWLFWGDVCRF